MHQIYTGPNFFQQIFGRCNLLDFAELRMRSCGAWSEWLGLGFKHQPRVPPRSPPCSFFYRCILQGAIDFAEAALSANPASRIAAHHANFLAAFSASAFARCNWFCGGCFMCNPA
ncbi:MAG: hypothetical protein WA977_08740 [Halobacteriota archaeon]